MSEELSDVKKTAHDVDRGDNSRRWEHEASAHNSQRSLGEKILGQNKLTGDEVMRVEADRDNVEHDETHPEVPTLEYDLVDMHDREHGTQKVSLSENVENAQVLALQTVIDQEMGPGNAAMLVRNPRIRMPDGSLVSWHEFTAPALERARNTA